MKARELKIEATKTYASEDNARKAIAKYPAISDNDSLRYIIMRTADNRFFPLFLGETALQNGVHFVFNIAA